MFLYNWPQWLDPSVYKKTFFKLEIHQYAKIIFRCVFRRVKSMPLCMFFSKHYTEGHNNAKHDDVFNVLFIQKGMI